MITIINDNHYQLFENKFDFRVRKRGYHINSDFKLFSFATTAGLFIFWKLFFWNFYFSFLFFWKNFFRRGIIFGEFYFSFLIFWKFIFRFLFWSWILFCWRIILCGLFLYIYFVSILLITIIHSTYCYYKNIIFFYLLLIKLIVVVCMECWA